MTIFQGSHDQLLFTMTMFWFPFKAHFRLGHVWHLFDAVVFLNCAGVSFRSETMARFLHENMGMRLVHSWMCGVPTSHPTANATLLWEQIQSNSNMPEACNLDIYAYKLVRILQNWGVRMHSVGRKKAEWVKVIHCFQYSGRANLKPAEEIGSSMFSFHRTSQHIPVSSAMKWSCFISCWSFDLLCTLTGTSTFCKFIELGASWRNSSTITGSLSSLASISNWHVYTSLYFVLCINPDGPPNLDYGAPV